MAKYPVFRLWKWVVYSTWEKLQGKIPAGLLLLFMALLFGLTVTAIIGQGGYFL